MKWGYQDNFKYVYFFLWKNFARTKRTERKTNNFHLLRSICTRKKLLPLLFSICLILFCWLIFDCECFFCARNLFVKKINKQAWNCLDNIISLYYWIFIISRREKPNYCKIAEAKNVTTTRYAKGKTYRLH